MNDGYDVPVFSLYHCFFNEKKDKNDDRQLFDTYPIYLKNTLFLNDRKLNLLR